MPLREFSQENGLLDPALQQRTPSHNEGSGRNKKKVGRCRVKLSKRNIIIIILASVVVEVVAIITTYLCFHQQVNQLEARVEQLEAQGKQPETTSAPKTLLPPSCPQDWTLNAEFCYLFSDTESTWDLAYSSCSSSGGSLVLMDDPQAKAFINEHKAPAEYWIGVRRENSSKPWKLPNGTDAPVTTMYEIKGEGLCATLNYDVFSSTDCNSSRRSICRKPLHAV